MKPSRIEIPSGQSWSCHACTDCCRHHLYVPLSAQEKDRLEKQGWTAADGVDPSRMIVAGLNQYRLGHQPDGACVFLGPDRRCRIHTKFGEAAKPLACRLYPLLLHPAGRKVFVGLRFSCPSAARNLGDPLAQQAAAAGLADEILPTEFEKIPPPAVAATPGLDWPDFLRFVHWLNVTLAAENVPVALKLLRALHWLGKVERGYLDQITGDSADEILSALVRSAGEKVPALPRPPDKPSRFGRLFLRLLVLEHARTTTVADRKLGSAHRWEMLGASIRFALASGRVPDVRSELKPIPFAEIEKPFAPLTAAADAVLDRYFRVKVQSLQFCGKGFHDCALIEGFRNLALLYPVIIWLARWLALSQQPGRNELTETDVQNAVSIIDYQYGFAPHLPWRTRLMQQKNDIVRLCSWYA